MASGSISITAWGNHRASTIERCLPPVLGRGVSAGGLHRQPRNLPTPHPPENGRGVVCSMRGPQPCMPRRDFLITLGGEWSRAGLVAGMAEYVTLAGLRLTR